MSENVSSKDECYDYMIFVISFVFTFSIYKFFFFFLCTNEFVPLMNKLFAVIFVSFVNFARILSLSFTMRHASRVMYARGIHETF